MSEWMKRVMESRESVAGAIPVTAGHAAPTANRNRKRAASAKGVRVYGEDGAVQAVRRRGRSRTGHRGRAATGVVVAMTMMLAAWVGSLFGSGAISPQASYVVERLAVQSGSAPSYGTPPVYGHPSESLGHFQTTMIRKFMALDGVN